MGYSGKRTGPQDPTSRGHHGQGQEQKAQGEEEQGRGLTKPATKLSAALERAGRASALSGGSIMIGLSGGKDSLVTLDIIVRSGAFKRIECFAMYLVPGLKCFELPVLRAVDRYRKLQRISGKGFGSAFTNVTFPVHFVPHWELPDMLRNGICCPEYRGTSKLKSMRLVDTERALTAKTGIDFFAYGDRATDGLGRRLYTSKVDGVHPEWRRLWPIWDWRDAEVKAYLRARNIPLPEHMGDGKTSGIALTPMSLYHLKEKHPDDFQKLLSVFPHAEAQVLRVKRGDFNKLPKVPRRARPPKGH